jgi:hypothetical protein
MRENSIGLLPKPADSAARRIWIVNYLTMASVAVFISSDLALLNDPKAMNSSTIDDPHIDDPHPTPREWPTHQCRIDPCPPHQIPSRAG